MWPQFIQQAFLDGLIAGDGSVHKGNSHAVVYTASYDFAGDVQELVLRTGHCATVRENDRRGQKRLVNGAVIENKKVGYVVSITSRTNEHLFNRKYWRKEHYKGDVHCVTVPSGILYVRRNGKACWSGNTHELVRHRLSSFSQESTRYVDYELERNEAKAVCPPNQDPDAVLYTDNDGREITFRQIIEDCFFDYEALRKAGWRPEQARQALPIGIKSEIVVSGNFRQWRHIFHMRADLYAHWEIRGTMVRLLQEMQRILPGVFDDFVYGGTCQDGIPWYIRKLDFRNVMLRQLPLLTPEEKAAAMEVLGT
jgi:hypothetical protein